MELNTEIVEALKLKAQLETLSNLLKEEYKNKNICMTPNQPAIGKKYGIDWGSNLAFVLAYIIELNK
jgi:hypothetical protein